MQLLHENVSYPLLSMRLFLLIRNVSLKQNRVNRIIGRFRSIVINFSLCALRRCIHDKVYCGCFVDNFEHEVSYTIFPAILYMLWFQIIVNDSLFYWLLFEWLTRTAND